MKRKPRKIEDHPHTCTRCPFNGRNANGKPYDHEAAAACLSCKVDRKSCGLSNHGVSWVHMDAAGNPATVYAGRIAPDYAPRDPSAFALSGVSHGSADWLKMTMCEFSALDDFAVRLIVKLWHGMTIRDAARALHVTPRTVRERLRRILSASPRMRAAIQAARRGLFEIPKGSAHVNRHGEVLSFNNASRG